MAQTEREKQLYDLAYGSVLSGAQAEKPAYAGTYENQLNDLYNRIANREKFSYDVNADPLYQSYKDQYIQGGKLAMKDTMGQAAALTGGYGNTYGQQVGQQAYDAYLQNLSAAIPELYGMAYKQYQDEGDQLKDLYGLVGQQRDAEYGRYRDALGDWERGQAVLRDLEAQEHDRRLQEEAIAREQERYDYQKAWNEDQRAYERDRYAEQTAYDREQEAAAIQRALENQSYERRTSEEKEAYARQQQAAAIGRQLEAQEYERRMAAEAIQRQQEQQAWERNKYEDETSWKRQQQEYANLVAIIKATGYMPSQAELAAAGMSYEEANALSSEFFNQKAMEELAADLARDRATYGSSGGGGRSSGGSSYNYDYDDYDYDYAPAAGFTVDRNGDVIFTGTQDQYNNLSEKTREAADAAVAAQEKGKSMTEYYKNQAEKEKKKKGNGGR